MPISGDGILQAEFDPAWAAVRLVVDGGMWPSAVTTITVTRQVAGVADIAVRGVEKRAVVGGYFVGSDTEMPLEEAVSYQVQGWSAAGVLVKTVAVAVSTSGAAAGLWIKVPGMPDSTAHARFRTLGDITQDSIGGNYVIASDGGTVTQSVAHGSGVGPTSTTIGLGATVGPQLDRLRAALAAAGRVFLLQPVGSSDLDAGWYFVKSVSRSNPAGIEKYPSRWLALAVESTSMPAGMGQGVPGVTWAGVVDTYPTWSALLAAKPTWFDLQKSL